MTRAPIRVLIADDSATIRNALAALLAEDRRMEVVGEAADGLKAVELARSIRPDVITMDVLMPKLDGLQAIKLIMAEAPSRILVVSSVVEDRELNLSFRAMAAGALELISKPQTGKQESLRQWGARVAESIRLMAEVPVVTRRRAHSGPTPVPRLMGDEARILGIAASTGGPAALAFILGALPADLPVPIVIAQHIGEGFVVGLQRWFAEVSKLKVHLAVDGARIKPGNVYLAPGGHDLEIDPYADVDQGGTLRINRSSGGHSPSGDKLLHSIARAYGRSSVGMVLTGMGEDGARGLLSIHKMNGITIAQDEATSTVYGMPQAAANLGAAQNILPLESIPGFVRALCERKRPLGASSGD